MKDTLIQIQEEHRTLDNRIKENPQWHSIVKTLSIHNKNLLKTPRDNMQATYKRNPIRITPDFPIKRKSWNNVFQIIEDYCGSLV